MRRRHLRGVMAIERQVYARPWSPNLFVAEMTEPNNRCYLVARIDKVVVGYGGMICYGDEAHVTNIAVDPQQHRPQDRNPAAARADRAARSNWADTRCASRSESRTGGRSASTGGSDSTPWGSGGTTTRSCSEDALIMWTDDVRQRAYQRPSARRSRPSSRRWCAPRDHARASRPRATRPPSRWSRTASSFARTSSRRRYICTSDSGAWCRRSLRAPMWRRSTRCSMRRSPKRGSDSRDIGGRGRHGRPWSRRRAARRHGRSQGRGARDRVPTSSG